MVDCKKIYEWSLRRLTRKSKSNNKKTKGEGITGLAFLKQGLGKKMFMKTCKKYKGYKVYKNEDDFNKKKDKEDKKIDELFKKFK